MLLSPVNIQEHVFSPTGSTSSALTRRHVSPPADWGSEAEGGGAGRREEARPEESTYVCWRHAAGSAGRKTQGDHGPESQPEAGQEGGQGGGETASRDPQ